MLVFLSIKTSIKGDKPVNQDAILTYEDGTLIVLALADGLGSMPYSDKGSLTICRSVVKNVKKSIQTSSPLSGTDILNYWDASLRMKGFALQDCLTTSSFVLINKREKKVTVAQIGDSQIYLILDGKFIDNSKEKEFANITECVGLGNGVKYSVCGLHFEKSIRVLIASDGICDELEPNIIPGLADYLVERYSTIAKEKRNLVLSGEVRRSFSKRNSDDKSMIFLWNE